MTNLLPIPEQKRVWAVYRARFIIALSLVLLAIAFLGGIVLIPSYLALEIASPTQSDIATSHVATTSDPVGLARAQALARALSPILTATSSPTRVIEQALERKPAGVTVLQIAFSASNSQITLSGSGNRDTVSAYRDALTKSPLFSSVSIPVSALVGSGVGRFSLTLIGTF